MSQLVFEQITLYSNLPTVLNSHTPFHAVLGVLTDYPIPKPLLPHEMKKTARSKVRTAECETKFRAKSERPSNQKKFTMMDSVQVYEPVYYYCGREPHKSRDESYKMRPPGDANLNFKLKEKEKTVSVSELQLEVDAGPSTAKNLTFDSVPF